MERVLSVIDKASRIVGESVSYLLWIGAAMLAWEVLSRYFFNAPTVWAHGYSQRIFGSYFILVGAYTLVQDGHVRIDLVINQYPFRVRKVFDLLNYGFLLLWSSVLIREGWLFFLESWQLREADEMALAHPVYPVKFILFAGAVLIMLQGLAMFIRSGADLIKGDKLVKGDIDES